MKRPHAALHYMILAIHLLWGSAVFHRPPLPDILTGYSRFPDIMPWAMWGWGALAVGVLMIVARPGTIWGQLAHFVSSVWLFLVAGVLASTVGITPAGTTYTALAGGSLLLFAADFRAWLPRSTHIQRITAHPPRWLTRRRDGP